MPEHKLQSQKKNGLIIGNNSKEIFQIIQLQIMLMNLFLLALTAKKQYPKNITECIFLCAKQHRQASK